MSTWKGSYYLWIPIFYVLSVAVIVLPAVVALDLAFLNGTPNRVLAGLAAAISAVMAWANLGQRTANFDNARSNLEDAILQYGIDHDKEKLLAAYIKQKQLVRDKEPITPQAPHG
jgi:hypothetical protein